VAIAAECFHLALELVEECFHGGREKHRDQQVLRIEHLSYIPLDELVLDFFLTDGFQYLALAARADDV
jgi:hypothetical protein